VSEFSPVVRVVDDDPSFLVAVARLLRRAAYTVQTFASAGDLLAKMDDSAGCVMADLRMRAPIHRLTPRELACYARESPGNSDKQIAADLGINERTVKLHRTVITTKLQVRSVAELTKLVQAASLFESTAENLP
jgi:FixJ family two-component response regulator